jgi:hypothetical protein
MEEFATVRAFLRHRHFIVPICGILPALVIGYGAWRLADPAIALIAAVIGIAGYFIGRLVADLVALLAEMLLPK